MLHRRQAHATSGAPKASEIRRLADLLCPVCGVQHNFRLRQQRDKTMAAFRLGALRDLFGRPDESKRRKPEEAQKAADIALQRGSRLLTDSASSYRALTGYLHEYVNHTKKEYARGDVHENRAECLFSLLKP